MCDFWRSPTVLLGGNLHLTRMNKQLCTNKKHWQFTSIQIKSSRVDISTQFFENCAGPRPTVANRKKQLTPGVFQQGIMKLLSQHAFGAWENALADRADRHDVFRAAAHPNFISLLQCGEREAIFVHAFIHCFCRLHQPISDIGRNQ